MAASAEASEIMSRLLRLGILIGAVYGVLQWLGRTAGTSRAERRQPLPGDDVIERPMFVTMHATTIGAGPREIWPWLAQMGWHQGGWYTAQWVDRLLFPANLPSADRILPEFQHRAIGDFVPDGAPETGCGFVIEGIDPNHHLLLHSRTHLPAAWRRRGAWLDWTWVFALERRGDARTRLLVRSRVRLGPWWAKAAYWLAIVPADFVMTRQMLRGIAERAERRLDLSIASTASTAGAASAATQNPTSEGAR